MHIPAFIAAAAGLAYGLSGIQAMRPAPQSSADTSTVHKPVPLPFLHCSFYFNLFLFFF